MTRIIFEANVSKTRTIQMIMTTVNKWKYKKMNWKIWFTFETKVSTTRSNWTHGCCWIFPFHTVLLPSITWRSGWFDKLDHDNHLHQALDQPSDDQKDDDHDAWSESHFVSPVDDEDHIATTRFDDFLFVFLEKAKTCPNMFLQLPSLPDPGYFSFLNKTNFTEQTTPWVEFPN